jgi:hypothetical protein
VNDFVIDTRPYVASLLHSGIRVLIYVGTYDWICNFVGNEVSLPSRPSYLTQHTSHTTTHTQLTPPSASSAPSNGKASPTSDTNRKITRRNGLAVYGGRAAT